MDKIYINNLEFIGYHGVLSEEKQLGQKFIVSIVLETNLSEEIIEDNISNTTHYGEVAKTVERVFFSKKYDLIESLAGDIAREILLSYSLVDGVKVVIKKPWAPVGLILQDVSVEIERKWEKVFLSIGSNIGNRRENLEKAIEKIQEISGVQLIKTSTFLETKPFGYEQQDDFLNACLELRTFISPRKLLKTLLEIEKSMGRERKIKWGPRIIDLDIIFYGKMIMEDEDLLIPHPYMEFRKFVLEPLEEIAKNYVHPLLNKRISTLRKELEENESRK